MRQSILFGSTRVERDIIVGALYRVEPVRPHTKHRGRLCELLAEDAVPWRCFDGKVPVRFLDDGRAAGVRWWDLQLVAPPMPSRSNALHDWLEKLAEKATGLRHEVAMLSEDDPTRVLLIVQLEALSERARTAAARLRALEAKAETRERRTSQ